MGCLRAFIWHKGYEAGDHYSIRQEHFNNLYLVNFTLSLFNYRDAWLPVLLSGIGGTKLASTISSGKHIFSFLIICFIYTFSIIAMLVSLCFCLTCNRGV